MALSEWEKRKIRREISGMNFWERKKKLASWENFLSWVKSIAGFMADVASIIHAALEIWNSFR